MKNVWKKVLAKLKKKYKEKANKKAKEKKTAKEMQRKKQDKKQRKRNVTWWNWIWLGKKLKADIIHQFPKQYIPFNVFSAVTNLDGLAKLLFAESNLYAQQNGREFRTNKQEMIAFLGINYIIFINKLPTIKILGECVQFIGNEIIRNVMGRWRFGDIFWNL